MVVTDVMVVTDLRLCRDCAHAKPDAEDFLRYRNRCYHPNVVRRNAAALANTSAEIWPSVSCIVERRRPGARAPCGEDGRLWEIKP